MGDEHGSKRLRSDSPTRSLALTKAKSADCLGECLTFEFSISSWSAVDDHHDTVYSSIDSVRPVDFGDGRTFNVRLARNGAKALENAEEDGDFDMAPVEFQLVRFYDADVITLEDTHWPPHFKLYGFRFTDSDSYVELLNTTQVKRLRNADYRDGTPSRTVSLAFALPGRLARCEDVGVSHDLLQKRVDEFRNDSSAIHLALIVPRPQEYINGKADGSTSIEILQEEDDGEDSSSDSSDHEQS